jgi:glutamate 5-kinase
MERMNMLKHVKRVVVKVGTSTLTHSTGHMNFNQIDLLSRQLSDIQNQGYEVILVTSGAIGAGVGKLNLKKRPKAIPEQQAAAAVGQGVLMHLYEKYFSEYGKIVGQILVTNDDFKDSVRRQHARDVFETLLRMNVIPIVNENDAVVVDEIKVGDNDTLSALVCKNIEADLLILLSDIDGLFSDDPRVNKDAILIHTVDRIDDNLKALAKGAGSDLGTGGMATKLKAAQIATDGGSYMVIANGSTDKVLNRIMAGESLGTLFVPKRHRAVE